MTSEILANKLGPRACLGGSGGTGTGTGTGIGICDVDPDLAGVTVVVMDEVHYINDPERGPAWERALTLLPPDVQVVALSATLRHPERFCEWLGLRAARAAPPRRARVVQRRDRQVPLHFGVYDVRGDFVELHTEGGGKVESAVAYTTEAYERATARGAVKGTQTSRSPTAVLLAQLERDDRLPAIVFALSRDRCAELAHGCAERNLLVPPRPVRIEGNGKDQDDEDDYAFAWRVEQHQEIASDVRRRQNDAWRRHMLPFAADLERVPGLDEFRALLDRGVAYHHSGMLPVLREFVELLFQARLLRVVFATETLGVGINMPARTVVFAQLDKPDAASSSEHTHSSSSCQDPCVRRSLRPDEFWQMAGRAGRRGMDERGYVVYSPGILMLSGKSATAYAVRELLTGGMPAATSQLRVDAETVLRHIASGRGTGNDATDSSPVVADELEGSLMRHENRRAAAEVRRLLAALGPPPSPDVRRSLARHLELGWKLEGKAAVALADDAGSAFGRIRLTPRQRKDAAAELGRIEAELVRAFGCGSVRAMLEAARTRDCYEAEAGAYDRDLRDRWAQQADRLVEGGFARWASPPPTGSQAEGEGEGTHGYRLTVQGMACARLVEGRPLERGRAICEGRLDDLDAPRALEWLAGFVGEPVRLLADPPELPRPLVAPSTSADDEDEDRHNVGAAALVRTWLASGRDVRVVAGLVGFAGLGAFVRVVLRVAAFAEEARTVLLGLGRYEAYNRLEPCSGLLQAGVVSARSLYVNFSNS